MCSHTAISCDTVIATGMTLVPPAALQVTAVTMSLRADFLSSRKRSHHANILNRSRSFALNTSESLRLISALETVSETTHLMHQKYTDCTSTFSCGILAFLPLDVRCM